MTTKATTPRVLTAVICVLRTSAPAILALDHIVQLLDAFLDVPVLSSLPKAAASGSVRWFDRVYQHTLPPQIDDKDWLGEYTLSNALKAAVEHGHVAIVQRIHALHPQRLTVRVLSIAAAKGDLAMFQWLFLHRNDDLCVPDNDGPGDAPRTVLPLASIKSLSCCLHAPYSVALRRKQLHIAKWLLENGYRPPPNSRKMAGDVAASRGDLEMVQWLHTHDIPYSFSKLAICNAAKHGHLQVVQYLVTNRSEGFITKAVHYAVMGGYDAIHEVLWLSGVVSAEAFEKLGMWGPSAAKAGRLDLLQSKRYEMQAADADQTMCYASLHGHFHVVQWLWQHHGIQPNATLAAIHGHLHILQWVHDHHELGSTNWGPRVMDCAATKGHLAVVQWLHANRPQEEACTTEAMDGAAMNGHLAVVQWLHEHRTEGCTVNAMNSAAMRGRLAMVQWLHAHRTEGCTADAKDFAAEYNHLPVVEWLHSHRAEGCTTQAMDKAARNGHLEMVQWLHRHGNGYTSAGMSHATLSVLKWLHFDRHHQWTTTEMTDMMDCAARKGDMGTLQFLHRYHPQCCSKKAASGTARQGHLPIVQWLHDKYPVKFDPETIASSAQRSGHLHIVQWLKEDQRLCPAEGGGSECTPRLRLIASVPLQADCFG